MIESIGRGSEPQARPFFSSTALGRDGEPLNSKQLQQQHRSAIQRTARLLEGCRGQDSSGLGGLGRLLLPFPVLLDSYATVHLRHADILHNYTWDSSAGIIQLQHGAETLYGEVFVLLSMESSSFSY